MPTENLSELLGRVSENSASQIDDLVGDFGRLREKLRTDGECIQREIEEYSRLSQQVMQLTKTIADERCHHRLSQYRGRRSAQIESAKISGHILSGHIHPGDAIPRRFPPTLSVEERNACLVVTDSAGQKLAYVYFEDRLLPRSSVKPELLARARAAGYGAPRKNAPAGFPSPGRGMYSSASTA